MLISRFRFRSKPPALCGPESTMLSAFAEKRPASSHFHSELHIRIHFGCKRSVTSRPRSAGPSHGIPWSVCSFISRFVPHPGVVRVRCVAGVAQWELRHFVARLTSRSTSIFLKDPCRAKGVSRAGLVSLSVSALLAPICRCSVIRPRRQYPQSGCDIGSHVSNHMCSSMCLLSLLVSHPAL